MSDLPEMPDRMAAEPAHDGDWRVGSLSYSRRGLAALFTWLLWGDLAWSLRDRIVPPLMQILFKKYDASDFLEGILFSSLPLALGLITGPVVSYFSDRHRGPRGRRIPFLFASTPAIVISILGLAFSAELGAHLQQLFHLEKWGTNFSVLLVLGFFWLAFELFCTVANLLYGALVNDVVPHGIMGRFYGIVRFLSLIVGIIFYWYFGKLVPLSSYVLIGLGFLYGLGFVLMCLKVREGEYPEPPPSARGAALNRFFTTVRTFFIEGFRSPYYLTFYAAGCFAFMTPVAVNLYSIFYADSVHLSTLAYGQCITFSYVISLGLAYPLGWLADRFHPLRLTILTLFLYCMVALWAAVCATDSGTYALALILHTVLVGSYFTVSASLAQRILPRENFAQISSAAMIFGSVLGIGFAPLLGTLLDRSHHNYRYTFLVAGVVSGFAVLFNWMLYRQFMKLGGPEHYKAPSTLVSI